MLDLECQGENCPPAPLLSTALKRCANSVCRTIWTIYILYIAIVLCNVTLIITVSLYRMRKLSDRSSLMGMYIVLCYAIFKSVSFCRLSNARLWNMFQNQWEFLAPIWNCRIQLVKVPMHLYIHITISQLIMSNACQSVISGTFIMFVCSHHYF